MESLHQPVLLHEIVEMLLPALKRTSPIFLDCTLGGGGHSRAIAESLSGKLTIIGLDQDPQSIERNRNQVIQAEKVILQKKNFRNLTSVLEKQGMENVDAILFDLGMSSDQLEKSGRGFSFSIDEPLLMTMGDPKEYLFTARDIVNTWEESVLADIIFGYGEERFARRIARKIIQYREKKKIETSSELAEIVVQAYPFIARRNRKTSPATKTFQALRIAVNDELNSLKEGLASGFKNLAPGGRMAVISFHSLEDRIVKNFYKDKGQNVGAVIITKKPVTASEIEIAENPRARSAKLRVIEKSKT